MNQRGFLWAWYPSIDSSSIKLSSCFSKHHEGLAATVSVEMSPAISRLCKAIPPSACVKTPAHDLFAAPGSCITETMNTLSYAPALYHQCSHLFSRLRYSNLLNDSSTRSFLETLIIFSVLLCTFFCSSEGGRRWVQHPRSNPSTINIGCVCGEKESILQEEVNMSKASCVLALYQSLTYKMPHVPWSLDWKYLVCWFGEQMSAGIERSLQFNSAICSSRLKLREVLLPHRPLLFGDGQTTPYLNNLLS